MPARCLRDGARAFFGGWVMADLPEKIARQEAKALGLRHYFTGDPCRDGHVAVRFVVNGWCKTCAAAESRKARARDPVRVRANNKKWRTANPDKVAAAAKRWNAANPERLRARRSAAAQRHKDQRRISQRAWRLKSQDRHQASNRLRRARLAGSDGAFTAADIVALRDRQRNKCTNCLRSFGRKPTYHIDHIVPVSRGGSNRITNIQLLCPGCNLRKRAKDPVQFARENGRLL